MNEIQGLTLRAGLALILVLGAVASTQAQASGKVNINTANAAELALLPRVGPSVADRIVQFREENGRFTNLDDLLLVRGIGEKTFELIEPYVKLEGATDLTEKVAVPRGTSSTKGESNDGA